MLSFFNDVIKNLRLNYLLHVRRCLIFRNWPSAHSTATLHFRKAANRPEMIFDFMVLFRFAIVLRLCLMFLTEIKYIRFLACCLFVYRASNTNIMEKYQYENVGGTKLRLWTELKTKHTFSSFSKYSRKNLCGLSGFLIHSCTIQSLRIA